MHFQGHECQIRAVTSPVTKLTDPEVAPKIPLEPLAMVWAEGHRAKPQVPVQMIRHRLLGGNLFAVGTAAGVPDVHFSNLPDSAVADELQGPTELSACRALVPHRSRNLVFLGQLSESSGLVDGSRERLLAEDVLAGFDGIGRGNGVSVVGCRDHNCVDLSVHRIEHLAKIAK